MNTGNSVNQISKNDALEFMKSVGRQHKAYVIDAIVDCTLYSQENPSEQRFGNREMSYFCRAFNITEYGASKQKNRIKGRYAKYANISGIEDYLRSILSKEWPGFRKETPRMDALIVDYVKSREQNANSVANKDLNTNRKSNKLYHGSNVNRNRYNHKVDYGLQKESYEETFVEDSVSDTQENATVEKLRKYMEERDRQGLANVEKLAYVSKVANQNPTQLISKNIDELVQASIAAEKNLNYQNSTQSYSNSQEMQDQREISVSQEERRRKNLLFFIISMIIGVIVVVFINQCVMAFPWFVNFILWLLCSDVIGKIIAKIIYKS